MGYIRYCGLPSLNLWYHIHKRFVKHAGSVETEFVKKHLLSDGTVVENQYFYVVSAVLADVGTINKTVILML